MKDFIQGKTIGMNILKVKGNVEIIQYYTVCKIH